MPALDKITSGRNPLVKMVRKAVARGELTASGSMIAESVHLLEEALRSGAEIERVIVSDSASHRVPSTVNALVLEDRLFTEIAATESSQGVMTLVRPRRWTIDDLFPATALVVVLDGLQDPGNAGAIVRAAEAFGATGVVFLKGTVCPYNPKAVRASAGSLFRLPFIDGLTATDFLKIEVPLYAAMPRAAMLASSANLKESCAIAIGNEGRGVSTEIAAAATPIAIPTVGVESLNASVAAGVLLYEARRQRI
jgi:RNA methyltransferase, TrmH family